MTNISINLLIGFLFVSILGTLAHFTYAWSNNNTFVGFVTPVNESTWEHMKLVFFPTLLYLPIASHFLKNEYPHITSALIYGILAGTLFIPVFFYTYSGVLGFHAMPLDIASFFIAAAITFLITYKCATLKPPYETFLILLTALFALCFVIFTYSPPAFGIFEEPST